MESSSDPKPSRRSAPGSGEVSKRWPPSFPSPGPPPFNCISKPFGAVSSMEPLIEGTGREIGRGMMARTKLISA